MFRSLSTTATDYQAATPFPHTVIDNWLDTERAMALQQEIMDISSTLSNIEGTYITRREALYNVVERETRFHEGVHGHWHTAPSNPVMMYRWRINIENTVTVAYRKEGGCAHL